MERGVAEKGGVSDFAKRADEKKEIHDKYFPYNIKYLHDYPPVN